MRIPESRKHLLLESSILLTSPNIDEIHINLLNKLIEIQFLVLYNTFWTRLPFFILFERNSQSTYIFHRLPWKWREKLVTFISGNVLAKYSPRCAWSTAIMITKTISYRFLLSASRLSHVDGLLKRKVGRSQKPDILMYGRKRLIILRYCLF